MSAGLAPGPDVMVTAGRLTPDVGVTVCAEAAVAIKVVAETARAICRKRYFDFKFAMTSFQVMTERLVPKADSAPEKAAPDPVWTRFPARGLPQSGSKGLSQSR